MTRRKGKIRRASFPPPPLPPSYHEENKKKFALQTNPICVFHDCVLLEKDYPKKTVLFFNV